jgi:ribosomal protein S12 methylthiotransferase
MIDDVPDTIKRERLERVQEAQRHITAERYEARIGAVAEALVEVVATPDAPARGRLAWQADDIDGLTSVVTDAPAGALIEVTVREVIDDYDFLAEFRRVLSLAQPPSDAPRRTRELPMMATTVGSFGR